MGAIDKHVQPFSRPFTMRDLVSHALTFLIGLSLGFLISLQLNSSFPGPLVVFQAASNLVSSTSPPVPPPSPRNGSFNSSTSISLKEECQSVMHNMSDQELLLAASRKVFRGTPRLLYNLRSLTSSLQPNSSSNFRLLWSKNPQPGIVY
ncbi:hypothetical protein Golob_019313, partial [Gossypium lobatum]|nr:hypothetical protein [Gossypium lobatum]